MDEVELVKKYLSGEYTDVQLNYWIVQNKFNKKKIENIIEYTRKLEPFVVASTLVALFMLFHLFLGLISFNELFGKIVFK